MKPTLKYRALLVAASSLLAAHAANAANSLYAAGDLMLTFQQVGGGNTVYVDLGNSATLYRGTAAGADVATNIDFININSTLVSAFGSGWASDPSIYAGLAGVNSTSSTSSTLVNGYPPRTLYVSAPRADVGTLGQANSVTPTVASNTLMTTAASGIQTQNNVFGTLPSDTLQAVVTTDVSKIQTQQPITTFQGNNLRLAGYIIAETTQAITKELCIFFKFNSPKIVFFDDLQCGSQACNFIRKKCRTENSRKGHIRIISCKLF